MKKGIDHVAIILDGNRRYAKKKRLPISEGHRKGAKNVEKLMDWCLELGIKEITLYSFSTENFKRDPKQVKYLMGNFLKNIKKLKNDKKTQKKGIRIDFIGRLTMFSKEIQKEMRYLMDKTKKNRKLIVNFAMAYGGRAEIVDAVQDIVDKKIKKIDEEVIRKNLYIRDYPNLVIRPGGEFRVSNFLTWQSAYSEWYFSNKLWPEFSKKEFISALNDYKKRERRYGR